MGLKTAEGRLRLPPTIRLVDGLRFTLHGLIAPLAHLLQTKRHKAFDDCRFIGLALDGTGAGRWREKVCDLCRPYRNQQREILGYHHQLVLIQCRGHRPDLALRR